MSETAKPSEGQEKEIMEVAQFRFITFFIKESHIVLNQEGEFNIQVNFYPKGYIFQSLNQFHLELALEIKEAANKFDIRVVSVSTFEFNAEADIEQYKQSFFIKNAPAIVFPYIRAYISSLTAQSGLFTVTLPTFNVTAIGELLKGNIQDME